MIKKIAFAFYLFITSLALPFPVLAHAYGVSFEKEVDGYLVDVGYSTEEFVTATPVSFDFDLIDTQNQERVPFTDVWVRINQGTQTVFATGIHKQNLGGATLLHTFGQQGPYELIVRYQNNGEEIVSATFPLQVRQGNDSSSASLSGGNFILLGIIAGLIVGHLVTAFLIFKNRGKKS